MSVRNAGTFSADYAAVISLKRELFNYIKPSRIFMYFIPELLSSKPEHIS
jgi:hypothetical protein